MGTRLRIQVGYQKSTAPSGETTAGVGGQERGEGCEVESEGSGGPEAGRRWQTVCER